jgi:hypothetical protein
MLDADLADLYGVSTKVLNQAVKRNKERFPNEFMFQLTKHEKEEVVTNCDVIARKCVSGLTISVYVSQRFLKNVDAPSPVLWTDST